jgi:hypothetical protein
MKYDNMCIKLKYLIFCLLFCLSACSSKHENLSNDTIAIVGNKMLTKRDLSSIIKTAGEFPDSAAFVRTYIEKWAENELIYSQAEKYYKNDFEIEKMVDDYRKTLVVNKFKRQIIEDETPKAMESELLEFYEAHKSNFKLSSPIIKGALLKIPQKSPQISLLKAAAKKLDQKSIEQIEKYSLKTPISYNFFIDKWVKYDDIKALLPSPDNQMNNFLSNNRLYEMKDSANIYYFSIIDLLAEGSHIPFELVRDNILEILRDKKELEFIENYSKELYNKALKKGDVVLKSE